jgi:cytochrome c peroxidase
MEFHLRPLLIASAIVALAAWAALAVVVAPDYDPLGGPVRAQDPDAALLKEVRALFAKLPADFGEAEYPIARERVALGRKLFFDPRWSIDQNVSCATCHFPSLYRSDGLKKSIGVGDQQHVRNAPTVLNIAGDFAGNWRGELENVEEQAIKAALGRFSTGHTDHSAWIAQIEAMEGYRTLFQRAFPGESNPVTPTNLSLAIGAYERTLVTPAPFDAYLDGNISALSRQARSGLRTFIDTGCAACHNGMNVGGGMLQKFGVYRDYWEATGSEEIDKGRFDVTEDEADLYVFKVPLLRNVAMTAPYFHDGSVATLPEAVRIMATVQLDKTLSDHEVDDIVAFLSSLTGELPGNFATVPILPPRGPQ